MGWRLTVTAVFLTLTVACGGDNSTPTTPSSGSPGGPSISIVAGAIGLTTTAYSPSPQTIAQGSTITFVNNDSAAHGDERRHVRHGHHLAGRTRLGHPAEHRLVHVSVYVAPQHDRDAHRPVEARSIRCEAYRLSSRSAP